MSSSAGWPRVRLLQVESGDARDLDDRDDDYRVPVPH
jgi:hypothetical protein